MAKGKRSELVAGLFVLLALAAGVGVPVFLCEQGARRRGLDLRVAAADAEYVFKSGWCPLRPTPKEREN